MVCSLLLHRARSAAETRKLVDELAVWVDKLHRHRIEQAQSGTHDYVKKASGIWWDLYYRRRQSETRGLTGVLVEQADALGVPVPLNRRLVEMIYEIEDGRREPGYHNLEELYAFGQREGLLLPLPFASGKETRQFAWTYRVIEADGEWLLQSLRDGSWVDLYSFFLTPCLAVDFEPANHYMSTHPDSRFVQTLTVQLPTPEVRHVLRNRELVLDRGATVTRRVLADDDELLAVLTEVFGLRFPAGTRFGYREET